MDSTVFTINLATWVPTRVIKHLRNPIHMTKPLGQRTNSFDQVDSWQQLNVKFNNNNNNKEHPTSHEASWLLGKCNPNLKHGWSWLITCKWNSHKWPVILSHLFSLLWFHWSPLNHHGYLLDYQRWQHFE